MTVPVKVFLMCCLLQGISCDHVNLPQMVRGLNGSCVRIPCSFMLQSGWLKYLDNSCKAVWQRGHWRSTVFDSSLTEGNYNILQGALTGNLREKDCTTIFYNLPFDHYDYYRFRLECNNRLKGTFPGTVYINTREPLPSPVITPYSLEAEEGTPVTLRCSAVSPCPDLPPTLTWTPSFGDTEEITGSITSVMNFTASYLHHGRTISCAAVYKRQEASDVSYQTTLTISVLYPPKNTSVSDPGPVQEGSWVVLTCHTDAHPAANSYIWYKGDGDQMSSVSSRKELLTKVSEDQRQYYCAVSNRFGTQNSSIFQMDVQFAPKEVSISVDPPGPVQEGSSVTLTCSARANPALINYTWYRNDQEAAASGPTLVLERVDLSHTGGYYCEARNERGVEESSTVQLDVHYAPKNTSVLVDPSGAVPAGSSVTLTCTTMAKPAAENFTWYRVDGRQDQRIGSESHLTFNVTKRLQDKYYCTAINVHGTQKSEAVGINITFAPEIMASSTCIRLSSEIRCTCDTHGNPRPRLEWELAGKLVNDSSDLLTGEETFGNTSLRSIITFSQQDEGVPSVVCFSTNSLGSNSLALKLVSSDNHSDYPAMWMSIGSVMGVLLLCVLLYVFIYRKRKPGCSSAKQLVSSSESLAPVRADSLQADQIYANIIILEEDSLHYAELDFVKLRAEFGDGKIRGMASRTTEYAEIHLHNKHSSRAEEEEPAADSDKMMESETLNSA